MSINRVNISGHLTRDPELRMTPKGTQVLSFGIAVNDRRLNRETNQWEDYPNFVECTMFGTRAEAVGRIVRKGMKVSIDGKLRFNQWETKDGQKRSRENLSSCRIRKQYGKLYGGRYHIRSISRHADYISRRTDADE